MGTVRCTVGNNLTPPRGMPWQRLSVQVSKNFFHTHQAVQFMRSTLHSIYFVHPSHPSWPYSCWAVSHYSDPRLFGLAADTPAQTRPYVRATPLPCLCCCRSDIFANGNALALPVLVYVQGSNLRDRMAPTPLPRPSTCTSLGSISCPV